MSDQTPDLQGAVPIGATAQLEESLKRTGVLCPGCSEPTGGHYSIRRPGDGLPSLSHGEMYEFLFLHPTVVPSGGLTIRAERVYACAREDCAWALALLGESPAGVRCVPIYDIPGEAT